MTVTVQRSALTGTTEELSALLGRSARTFPFGARFRRASLEHEERVGHLCEAIALQLGLAPEQAADVRLAGELHDVGKGVVPEAVLRKPGKLNAEEWALVQRHPAAGAEILVLAGLDDVAGWVLAHHERPDGLGYPYGLTDDELPLEPRILAAADSFDAMTSERPYKTSLSIDEACAELEAGVGSPFDGEVVAALLRCV